jgi:hypothetical protein
MGQSLSERAMLVTLSISQWTARKHDKAVSKEVDNLHGTDNAGRYHKQLLTGEYKEKLRAIQQKVNVIRSFHYTNTLPWLDAGPRILTARCLQKYRVQMTVHIEEFKDLVELFCAEYAFALGQAEADLNSLYSAKDYPATVGDLRRRFHASIAYRPLADEKDFRVKMADDELQAMKQEMAQSMAETRDVINQDLWERLYKPVKHMAETLKDETKVFRDTLVDNLLQVCALLPDLNINDNMDLETKRKEIEQNLCDTDVKKAEAIAETMAGYMGN